MKFPLFIFSIFTLVGFLVSELRLDGRYLALFMAMGASAALMEYLVPKFPKLRQRMRLMLMFLTGGFLLGFLSIYKGVNFQFPQIIFDACAGLAEGALIQLLIARIALPFIFGNGFCSRVCWDGLIFELINQKIPKPLKASQRSQKPAWFYLTAVTIMACVISIEWNPAGNIDQKRFWVIGENLFIIILGIILTARYGSRAYCRMLCPFITISGLLSRFSLFKITPIRSNACIECQKCVKACPMLIDVMAYVRQNRRIDHSNCIICERCVDACPEKCLKLHWKHVPRLS
jgi:ferredoxin-type protein NapH